MAGFQVSTEAHLAELQEHLFQSIDQPSQALDLLVPPQRLCAGTALSHRNGMYEFQRIPH
jgi:hypothetical protein